MFEAGCIGIRTNTCHCFIKPGIITGLHGMIFRCVANVIFLPNRQRFPECRRIPNLPHRLKAGSASLCENLPSLFRVAVIAQRVTQTSQTKNAAVHKTAVFFIDIFYDGIRNLELRPVREKAHIQRQRVRRLRTECRVFLVIEFFNDFVLYEITLCPVKNGIFIIAQDPGRLRDEHQIQIMERR